MFVNDLTKWWDSDTKGLVKKGSADWAYLLEFNSGPY